MKKLSKVILGITLLSGTVYADFKDEVALQTNRMYSNFEMKMRADERLKIGKNNLKILIEHNKHSFANADITLEINYNGKKTVYNYTDVNNLGYYKFPVEFSTKGVYNYRIKFSKAGFNERSFFGQLSL